MDQTVGWMGGQMTIWAVLAVLVVVDVVRKESVHEEMIGRKYINQVTAGSFRVVVNGYGVIGNRVADATAATVQGLDWSDTGIPGITKGALRCSTT